MRSEVNPANPATLALPTPITSRFLRKRDWGRRSMNIKGLRAAALARATQASPYAAKALKVTSRGVQHTLRSLPTPLPTNLLELRQSFLALAASAPGAAERWWSAAHPVAPIEGKLLESLKSRSNLSEAQAT